MIKNFLQKHRVVLITIIITSTLTALVASGYFVIKSEKKDANRQVEALQKSIEELQVKTESSVKNEEHQEVNKEPEKDTPVPEAITQQTPATKKNTDIAPVETKTKVVEEEEEEEEEETISCVAFDGTVLEVTENECEVIKQKNAIIEKVLDKYDACIEKCEEEFQDGLDQGYDPYYVEEYNRNIKKCAEERNEKLEKLK